LEKINIMKKIVIGLGEILWDLLPSGKVLGGAPANFAYHASQLGFNGYTVSAIGSDLLGKEILNNLKEKKLNFLLENVSFPTGTVVVTLDEKSIPQYEICEDVAWDNIPFTSQTEKLARNCDAVCFGSLAQRNIVSRTTILKFLEIVPKNALKIFDINLRQHYFSKELIESSLNICNILKLNEDEIIIVNKLFGLDMSEEKACNKLRSNYNINIVILTKGTAGSYIFHENGISFLPTPKVSVADTVGAGDAFTAAFTAAIMRGESIEKAHQLAVGVAAFVCTQHGAMPKLPY